MLKKLSALLLVLLCLTASALAEPFVTPVRHADQDTRDEMWALIINRVAPQVGVKPQEKWSAKRCREVTDLFEDAGFIISDEVKDELYRKPRAHRWYATEAWKMLIESQFGREWYWSLTDIHLFSQAKRNAGMITDRYLLPLPGDPSLEDMLTFFRKEIAAKPPMTTDPPEGYHFVARLMDWGGAVRWELWAYPDLGEEFPRSDFSMTYFLEQNTFTVDDYRLRNALTDSLN